MAGYEADCENRIPRVFDWLDVVRGEKGKQLPSWAPWCLLPLAGSWEIGRRTGVVEAGMPDTVSLIPAIAALYAWRQGKTIRRFDENLAEALATTEGTEHIAGGVLLSLPEWGIYVEQPAAMPTPWHGFIVHLEDDVSTGRTELRFAFDMPDRQLVGIPVPLGHETLAESLEAADEAAVSATAALGIDLPPVSPGSLSPLVAALAGPLALVCYICSQAADIVDADDPSYRPQRRSSGIHPETPAGCRWLPGWYGAAPSPSRIRTSQW
jgi:hypothetical protein